MESYVDVLNEQLGGSGYEFLNTGISSQTMLKKGLCNDLTPCSYWNTDAWQTALYSQPDIVTIMLGTNDAKYFNWEGIQQNLGDYYALDYVDMIRSVRRRAPLATIYIMIPPPLFDPYPYEMNATIINQVFPTLIRDIAAVMDVSVIDLYTAFNTAVDTKAVGGNSSILSCDGCHPTHDGNLIIAEAIRKAITGIIIGETVAAEA